MADAHRTELPLAGVAADNPRYTLMKEASFSKRHRQARIDRVTLVK